MAFLKESRFFAIVRAPFGREANDLVSAVAKADPSASLALRLRMTPRRDAIKFF